jgi:GTP-binding protein Era
VVLLPSRQKRTKSGPAGGKPRKLRGTVGAGRARTAEKAREAARAKKAEPAIAPEVAKKPDPRKREVKKLPPPPPVRATKKKPPPIEPSGLTRSGTVALIGRPNVGKSTLLNAALGASLAIVSRTAQTTRNTLLGVIHRVLATGDAAEILLLDTPGLHEGKTALNRRMNGAAQAAASNAEVVVFICDVPPKPKGDLRPHRQDLELLKAVGERSKIILVVNKIDTLRDKASMLTLIETLSHVRPFDAIVPVSALRNDGIDLVLEEAGKLLPEGPHAYGEDDMTDRPMRFFAAEYVREQVLERAREEVPHATAVSIDVFEERGNRTNISATVHVERAGQKKILIGEGGSMLRAIGENARKRIAELLGMPVHLELFVRETPSWRDNPGLLGELGYEEAKADAASRQKGPRA